MKDKMSFLLGSFSVGVSRLQNNSFFILHSSFLFIIVFLFASCGDVAEDERWMGPQEVAATKNVLVEDFTGQRCVNCPDATATIDELQQRISSRYGAGHVVAVAIHGGSMAISDDYPMGLATAEGDSMHNALGIDAWPAGVVDRTGGICRYSEWTARVVSRMAVIPSLEIACEASADEAQINVSVVITPLFSFDTSAERRLTVWLTESGITALQFMPDGSRNASYIHNHVFRASLTEPVGQLLAGGTQTVSLSLPIKATWNVAQLAVVAFVTEARGVEQVVEVKVKGNGE